MERKRITCPETSTVELIDYEPTPLGVLIAGCSRFLPRCSVSCSRECAVRMDGRVRRNQRADTQQDDSTPTRW
jgi:hypothetical protein